MAPGPQPPGKDCLVVAAAGYGKSSWLSSLAADAGGRYCAASELAADDCAAVGELPSRLGLLAVDDLDRLGAGAETALVRALAELPAGVPVVLAGRRSLSAESRAILRRPMVERAAADLALTPEANARVLREEHGITDVDVADQVHQLTGGWPALVHLIGDALARHGAEALPAALSEASTEIGEAAAGWLTAQVLADLPRAEARLLDVALDVGPVTPALCADLAGLADLSDLAEHDGADRAAQVGGVFGRLTRAGLLVPDVRAGGPRVGEAFRPVPLLAAVLRRARSGPAGADERLSAVAGSRAAAATAWYEEHGYPLAAAVLRQRRGDSPGALALVEDRAEEMLARGGAAEVVRLLEAEPPARRSERAQLVLGDARRMAGDAQGADRAFAALTARATDGEGWTAALAWRVAMVHYMKGELRAALDVCAVGLPAVTADDQDGDTVQLFVVRSAALFMLGEVEQARAVATEALHRADASGDAGARAAADLAAALSETGARREAHLRRAFTEAERAGDLVTLTRVLVNQADSLLDDARYDGALDVAQRALRTAEQGAPPGLVVTALYNVGEALLRLGRYDEAGYAFERSTRVAGCAGLHRRAPGLLGQAEVARQLGRREQARMAFEEAIEHARSEGELQLLVPALAGLTRLLLDGAETDRLGARGTAEEAERVAPAGLLPPALVARGWVALAEGDLAVAQDRAGRAITAARAGRSTPALADSLELAAAVCSDTDVARGYLTEALVLWQRAGAVPAADRILVLLGRLPGAAGPDRMAAKEAGSRLLALGVRAVDGAPVLPAEGVSAPLHIRVLGGFEVLVGGRPVPMTAWRSRQARTLVKMLVARRGRPIPRAEVCEILWPDDDPARTAHRLSVLLSVVRGVLDPAKAWEPDHYLRADLTGLSLDLSHATVDAIDLLRDTAHADQLARSGEEARARVLLAEVDAGYPGDAFDEEPYEAWANALREETRAVWMRALRTAAELARRAGEHDQAITTLVRLLAADPLDESAHRLLVGVLVEAGRHGEARRAFDRWGRAMRSIDAPGPPDSVLRAV